MMIPILLLSLFAEKVVTFIDRKELPAAVEKALLKDMPKGATMKAFEKEVVDGKVFFEVQMIVNGKGYEIVYQPNGKIEAIEQEASLKEMPAAVAKAIEKAAEGGKLVKVDIITEGKRKTYEGEIERGGKKTNFLFDGNGKAVKE